MGSKNNSNIGCSLRAIAGRLLFVFTILLTASIPTPAQDLSIDTDTLIWTVQSIRNTQTGEENTLASEFRTTANSVAWIQDSGNQVDQFHVTGRTSGWADPTIDGELTYSISWGKLVGQLQFNRQDSHVTIVMTMNRDGKNCMPFLFNVAAITKQNH